MKTIGIKCYYYCNILNIENLQNVFGCWPKVSMYLSILVISLAFSQQISTYLACKLVSDDTDGGQCKAPFLSDFSHAYPDSQFVTSLTYVQTNMYLLVIF